MAVRKTERSILIEQPNTAPKVASTVLDVGMWLQVNGVAGNVTKLAPGFPVEGLNLCPIAATDTDYASNKIITYDGISTTVDRFTMPVTNGTASSAVVGGKYNVYTDGYGLDVSTYRTLAFNTPAVATIVAGETITGTTSAATGTVAYIGPGQSLVIVPLTGTFVTGELITGGTSGGTARILTYAVGGTQFEVTKPAATGSTIVEVKVISTT